MRYRANLCISLLWVFLVELCPQTGRLGVDAIGSEAATRPGTTLVPLDRPLPDGSHLIITVKPIDVASIPDADLPKLRTTERDKNGRETETLSTLRPLTVFRVHYAVTDRGRSRPLGFFDHYFFGANNIPAEFTIYDAFLEGETVYVTYYYPRCPILKVLRSSADEKLRAKQIEDLYVVDQSSDLDIQIKSAQITGSAADKTMKVTIHAICDTVPKEAVVKIVPSKGSLSCIAGTLIDSTPDARSKTSKPTRSR